ncbi:hypothetical protein E3N88_00908 [Mikania micrantha]|uniref:Uncharacterized protein n=1 Tax=Mikania micrantha TaxID=192012 RepID=A0A5N6PZS7_9ASTR|nr:hypothetical protein E3N88_00908 [Mikania micrantha]
MVVEDRSIGFDKPHLVDWKSTQDAKCNIRPRLPPILFAFPTRSSRFCLRLPGQLSRKRVGDVKGGSLLMRQDSLLFTADVGLPRMLHTSPLRDSSSSMRFSPPSRVEQKCL